MARRCLGDPPLTGIYWRNTWKYQARGYRHLFWDAGTMLANVFAAAAALGLSARAVVGFMDDDVNGLLGIDPEREGALVLVAVGAARPAPPPPPRGPSRPRSCRSPASRWSYPLLVDAYVNSRLVSEAEVARLARARGSGSCIPTLSDCKT